MRGTDYVVKRVLFALGTVFVAITLNFVLFRAISGDAVSALRCRQCTQEFKEYQRRGLGLVIVLFIAGRLGLPTSGVKDPTLGILSNPGFIEVAVDRLEHMILPALTLGLVLFGEYTLIVRSAMLETLGEDYILTSRAKGLSNWATVWKHGFRNAMLPVITLVALSLGFIIGGAITVEYVFSYPGIGLLIVEAIDQRDYPVLQAAFLLLTLSVIFFNLIADLLYF